MLFDDECNKVESALLKPWRDSFKRIEKFLDSIDINYDEYFLYLEADERKRRLELSIRVNEDQTETYLLVIAFRDADSFEIIGIDEEDSTVIFSQYETENIKNFLEDIRSR